MGENEEKLENSLTKIAGLYVSKGSVWFVALLLGLMFVMAYYSYQVINGFGSAGLILESEGACSTDQCMRYVLESEHLRMQTAKVGMVTFNRFILSAIAFVVSLVTIVLGSVLVFDRVHAPSPENFAFTYKEYFLSFNSTFPGSLMVLLGSITLGINLYFAGPGSAKVYIETHPLYLPDVNYQLHQMLGRANTFALNVSEETQKEARSARSLISTPQTDIRSIDSSEALSLEGENTPETADQSTQGSK